MGTPKRGDANVLRLVVIFLRYLTRMTQSEFSKASRVDQGLLSRYEAGKQPPPEDSLRRMAEAAKVPWPLVMLLLRFVEVFLAARARRRSTSPTIDRAVLDPALQAFTSHLMEDAEEA